MEVKQLFAFINKKIFPTHGFLCKITHEDLESQLIAY